ncbi:hypothetical protein [Ferruginibacter sp.]|nr:hypothetical protein [Ferruginibacter sp.]
MSSNWLNKILDHETTPPEGVWENIANKLDKEEQLSTDLKTKMFTYEATPPNEALENIFSKLDNEEEKTASHYIERIQNFKEEAPIKTWANIVAKLDKAEAKIASLKGWQKSKKNIYIRMAAAASVIVIIASTIWLLNNKTDNSIEQTASVTTPQTLQNNIPSAENKSSNLPASDSPEKKSTAQNVASPSIKKVTEQQIADLQIADYVKGNKVDELATNPALSSKEKLQNSIGETPMDIALINTPGNYISITGPDGQTVKVSSKFSNLIGYLTEKDPAVQENLDIIIKESAKWKATFAVWRNKMTNNIIAPSFANFMDIIELSKVLEEKK